ncbi:MAG: biopolymer transporter ExbD [Ottowia sp.]|nr:biopolymer transporter ExbD [Ottowia sp.]
MRRKRYSRDSEAELDITAFMNLMIVLVPILLLGMVFSRITVVEVTLPPAATLAATPDDNKQVELVIRGDGMRVDFPRGVRLKTIPLTAEGEYDFELLSLVLQEVKRQLLEQGIERRNITLLPEQDIDYQTIVAAMDAVRSFRTLVAASVVDAALFPEIAFGDAPAAPAGGKAG